MVGCRSQAPLAQALKNCALAGEASAAIAAPARRSFFIFNFFLSILGKIARSCPTEEGYWTAIAAALRTHLVAAAVFLLLEAIHAARSRKSSWRRSSAFIRPRRRSS